MTPKHFDLLTHSLGMSTRNYRRKLDWWLNNENHRNHFATAEGCTDHPNILQLVEAGLMQRGRDISGGLVYFHVTPQGIREAREEFHRHRKAGLPT